jgi:hypothetical protein
VVALELSLDELNALGMEAAVIACSAPANKKMRMKLATIIVYIEQIRIGQVKGVDIGHNLCTVRWWHVMSLCQIPRYSDTASLQRILASDASAQVRGGS